MKSYIVSSGFAFRSSVSFEFHVVFNAYKPDDPKSKKLTVTYVFSEGRGSCSRNTSVIFKWRNNQSKGSLVWKKSDYRTSTSSMLKSVWKQTQSNRSIAARFPIRSISQHRWRHEVQQRPSLEYPEYPFIILSAPIVFQRHFRSFRSIFFNWNYFGFTSLNIEFIFVQKSSSNFKF
jgi:hypothetical protein